MEKVLRSVDEDAFELDCNNGYGVIKTECDVPGKKLFILLPIVL
jgi:hypothetical protein